MLGGGGQRVGTGPDGGDHLEAGAAAALARGPGSRRCRPRPRCAPSRRSPLRPSAELIIPVSGTGRNLRTDPGRWCIRTIRVGARGVCLRGRLYWSAVPSRDGGPQCPCMSRAAPGRAARPTAVRLLIVDDHEMFAESLRLALSAERDLAVVGTAATLAQARSLVVTSAPDVVLLDHRLPDGLGVDSIAELKTLRPERQDRGAHRRGRGLDAGDRHRGGLRRLHPQDQPARRAGGRGPDRRGRRDHGQLRPARPGC